MSKSDITLVISDGAGGIIRRYPLVWGEAYFQGGEMHMGWIPPAERLEGEDGLFEVIFTAVYEGDEATGILQEDGTPDMFWELLPSTPAGMEWLRSRKMTIGKYPTCMVLAHMAYSQISRLVFEMQMSASEYQTDYRFVTTMFTTGNFCVNVHGPDGIVESIELFLQPLSILWNPEAISEALARILAIYDQWPRYTAPQPAMLPEEIPDVVH